MRVDHAEGKASDAGTESKPLSGQPEIGSENALGGDEIQEARGSSPETDSNLTDGSNWGFSSLEIEALRDKLGNQHGEIKTHDGTPDEGVSEEVDAEQPTAVLSVASPLATATTPQIVRTVIQSAQLSRRRAIVAGVLVWALRGLTVVLLLGVSLDTWYANFSSPTTTSAPDSPSVYMEPTEAGDWTGLKVSSAVLGMEPLVGSGPWNVWPNSSGMRVFLKVAVLGEAPIQDGRPQIHAPNITALLPISVRHFELASKSQLEKVGDDYLKSLGVTGSTIGVIDTRDVLMQKDQTVRDHQVVISPVVYVLPLATSGKSVPVLMYYQIEVQVPDARPVSKGLAYSSLTLTWNPARAKASSSLSATGGSKVLTALACNCGFDNVRPNTAVQYQGTTVWFEQSPDSTLIFQVETRNWVTRTMAFANVALVPAFVGVCLELMFRRRHKSSNR